MRATSILNNSQQYTLDHGVSQQFSLISIYLKNILLSKVITQNQLSTCYPVVSQDKACLGVTLLSN